MQSYVLLSFRFYYYCCKDVNFKSTMPTTSEIFQSSWAKFEGLVKRKMGLKNHGSFLVFRIFDFKKKTLVELNSFWAFQTKSYLKMQLVN